MIIFNIIRRVTIKQSFAPCHIIKGEQHRLVSICAVSALTYHVLHFLQYYTGFSKSIRTEKNIVQIAQKNLDYSHVV